MSRMATKEYIGAKRRAYALADRAKRTRILDNEAKNAGEDLSFFAAHPALALRATPSGTVGLHCEGRNNTTTNQRKTIAEERKLSVQYLANQKLPDYLQSVFPI